MRNVLIPFVWLGVSTVQAFAPSYPMRVSMMSTVASHDMTTTGLPMVDPLAAAADVISITSSSMYLAETEAWVQPTAAVMDPLLNFLSFAMLARVVLSWYPEIKVSKMPWIVVAFPTEPLLRAVKGVVPPAFGVDITPVFWLGIFTFMHEILLGQQGLLTMKIRYGI